MVDMLGTAIFRFGLDLDEQLLKMEARFASPRVPMGGAGSDGMLRTVTFHFWALLFPARPPIEAQKRKIAVPSMPSEPAPPKPDAGQGPNPFTELRVPSPLCFPGRRLSGFRQWQLVARTGNEGAWKMEDRSPEHASRAGPAHGNPMPGKARIHLPGAGGNMGAIGGPETEDRSA